MMRSFAAAGTLAGLFVACGQPGITATTGTGRGGGAGGGGAGGPTILQHGTSGILLRGTIVNTRDTDTPFRGEVLVRGDAISCVAPSCAASPGAATATIIDTQGLLFPGLIDTHNHILYDIFDETDWSPSKVYTNHNQWGSEPRYSALVDAKQYINGEGSSPIDLSCELDKYGEMKGLIAGTTSIQGSSSPPSNQACYGSLARTIDQTPNGLPGDRIQTSTLFPTTSSADSVCANFANGKTDAYVVHCGEGVDAMALGEFQKLVTISTTDGCLLDKKTTIIHGAAFGDNEFTQMGQHHMSLVWSPRSNVFLYGGGTDMTKTANVPLALSKGVNVALGPDWSIGGSQNILDEIRFAHRVDTTVWGGQLSSKKLAQMVTVNAARALGLDAVIGALDVGKKADIAVFAGDAAQPYDALLAATPREVRLVMVGGVVLYGDLPLIAAGPSTPGCETINVCRVHKFACVAQNSTSNKLNQTLAQITSALSQALVDYDALNLTPYKFAPITPLVRCP